MQEETVLSLKILLYFEQTFPEAKAVLYEEITLGQKLAEPWFVKENAEYFLSRVSRSHKCGMGKKENWSNPIVLQSGQRDSFTFHYACGMN